MVLALTLTEPLKTGGRIYVYLHGLLNYMVGRQEHFALEVKNHNLTCSKAFVYILTHRTIRIIIVDFFFFYRQTMYYHKHGISRKKVG